MGRMHRARPSRRGSILVMALIAITGLAILSAGFFQVVVGSREALTGNLDDRRAYMLAEAGLSEAFTALRAGESGSVGTMALPASLGDGLFWVEAESVGGNRTMLTSTALVGSGRAAVATVVTTVPGARALFAQALTSQASLGLGTGTVCDSFDSSDPPGSSWTSQATSSYDDGVVSYQYAGSAGGVRSDGDVVLGNDVHVRGDVAYGVGGGLTANLGSQVFGSELTVADPFPFTPPQVPALVSDGPLTVAAGSTVEKAPGQHRFDSIEIQDGGRLRIQGPAQVVVGDLTGLSGATLEVDTSGGPVTFYVEGSYAHDPAFEVEATWGTAAELSFQFTGTADVELPAGATLRGGYYAPAARVVLGDDVEVFGAVTAQEIAAGERLRVHYDEVLAEEFFSAGDGSVDSEVQAWFETTVEPRWLRLNRKDPFALLGVHPSEAPRPWEAWL